MARTTILLYPPGRRKQVSQGSTKGPAFLLLAPSCFRRLDVAL
jgi:hypothetical protein